MNAPAFGRPDPSAFFDPLPILSFDVIMADPPWLFELRSDSGATKAPQGQYRCLPTAAIAAMPVGYLAKRDCWLWLWGTFPMMDAARFVMARWGFTYVTGGPWIKRGRTGKLAFGPGYVLRGNAEMFLLGRVGNPPTCSRSIRNVIEGPLRRHSEKPDEAYQVAETLFGPARRSDLFSRKTRPGWEAWGDEAGVFDDPAYKRAARQVRVPPAIACPDQFSLLDLAPCGEFRS